MAKIIQRIACKAIIQFKSKVLILREAVTYKDGTNIGRYHLPGGRIEPGEPFVSGLEREIFEETGLKVTYGKPIFVGEWFPVIRGQHNQIVAIFFVCTATSNKVRLSAEHDDYQWIDPKAYSEFDIMAPEDRVFKEYLNNSAGQQNRPGGKGKQM